MERCERSDLPRAMCAHCARIPNEQQTIGPPVAAPVLDPGLRLRVDYASDRWHSDFTAPIACDHADKPDGAVMCSACEEHLYRALADVPRLVADLEIHHAKQNVFLDRGVPQHPDPEDEQADESPLPYAAGASSTLRDLTTALGQRPARAALAALADWRRTLRRPDIEAFANRISRAVLKGFRVIDVVPYLTLYGVCPRCSAAIRQERVPPRGKVRCETCGYSDEVEKHLLTQLELGADTQMTLTRVVQVLNDAGERTSRQEIENLIYRDGLPREELPIWRDGRLAKVWHYRLGDVRDWRAKKRGRTRQQ